jgi:hypothetical protein
MFLAISLLELRAGAAVVAIGVGRRHSHVSAQMGA